MPKKKTRKQVPQMSRLEQGIRNIIFNVEQDPSRHTVAELIYSMRSALGLQPGERP